MKPIETAKPWPAREPKPMILDMGLGSREQGFPLQKPALPLPPLPSQPL